MKHWLQFAYRDTDTGKPVLNKNAGKMLSELEDISIESTTSLTSSGKGKNLKKKTQKKNQTGWAGVRPEHKQEHVKEIWKIISSL